MNIRLQEQFTTFSAFIELLPFPAFFVDSNLEKIFLANSKFSELVLFTRAELKGLPACLFITDWGNSIAQFEKILISDEQKDHQEQPIRTKLVNRNEKTIAVNLFVGCFSSPFKGALVFVDSKFTKLADETSVPINSLWQAIILFSEAFSEDNFLDAMRKCLQAGKLIIGANFLAIYQAQSKKPELILQTSLEPYQFFPKTLSIQDIIKLKKPINWISGKGKRPTGLLYRIAHQELLSYINSVPLGHPNAMIGLLVVGDLKKSPTEGELETTKFLGEIITRLTQKNIWFIKNKKDLENQEQQLRVSTLLEEQSKEGILLLDPSLNIIRLNSTAELMLGYAKKEVYGHPIDKVLIGTESLMPAFISAQEGNPTYNLGNIHLYRRDGDAFLSLVRIHPVIKKGIVENIIVFLQDLSRQEQIRLHAQQLEQRALLGEVTAIFAHEIRNPINNISTGLQLLEMNTSEEDPNRDSISRMITDCDRLTELVKSVLAYSRPTDYDMQELDLGLLISRLIDRLHPRITKLNVTTELEIEPNCPHILGNSHALEQVFNNLITNSLQAMDKKGGNLVIRIMTTKDSENEKYIIARIADTGPGIPNEVQKHIFQPFFTTKEHGTGLGLAISKRIISAHKGMIDLESFPGGSIFSIKFPIANSFA